MKLEAVSRIARPFYDMQGETNRENKLKLH